MFLPLSVLLPCVTCPWYSCTYLCESRLIYGVFCLISPPIVKYCCFREGATKVWVTLRRPGEPDALDYAPSQYLRKDACACVGTLLGGVTSQSAACQCHVPLSPLLLGQRSLHGNLYLGKEETGSVVRESEFQVTEESEVRHSPLLCAITPRHTTPPHPTPHQTTPHHITPHQTTSHYTTPRHTTPHHTTPHHTHAY